MLTLREIYIGKDMLTVREIIYIGYRLGHADSPEDHLYRLGTC